MTKPRFVTKKLLTEQEVIEHVKSFTKAKLLDGISRKEYHYNYKVICSTLFINGRHLKENLEVPHITSGKEFLKILDSLDQFNSLNIDIGSKVSIISAQLQGNYVELWGFLTPKTITNIHYENELLRQVEFNNDPNDVYPREDNIEYNGEPLFYSAFFDSKNSAEKALTWLTLNYPSSLKIVNNITENLKENEMSNIMKGLVGETDKIKGVDGKACWDGYKRMGTKKKGGKTVDNCVPIKNESAYEADLDDNEPRIVIGVYGAKSKEFRKKFANQQAQDRFFDHPDREGNFEIHYVQKANMAEEADKPIAFPFKRGDIIQVRYNKKWQEGQVEGIYNNKIHIYLPLEEKTLKVAREQLLNLVETQASRLREGVITQHDAKDPEVAIIGGAGTMSLSRLKKKAQGEAEQLANDLARGLFKAAAYNVKQLENTLKTIAAAEDEMEKGYFGEGVMDESSVPGRQVSHGVAKAAWKNLKHFVDIPEKVSGHVEDLDYYFNVGVTEDFTGQFAAERTAETNPYGGMRDHQNRGMLGEDDLDEARPMSPGLRAAQKNLAGLASGEVQRREAQRKAAEKAQRQSSKELERMLKPKKPALDQIWQKVEHAISNYFPDGDPIDFLGPYMQKVGIDWDDITRAAKKNGYKDLWDYWDTLASDTEADMRSDWEYSGKKGPEPKIHRFGMNETPNSNGPTRESSIMRGLTR